MALTIGHPRHLVVVATEANQQAERDKIQPSLTHEIEESEALATPRAIYRPLEISPDAFRLGEMPMKVLGFALP
jgi:hypothetical protein